MSVNNNNAKIGEKQAFDSYVSVEKLLLKEFEDDKFIIDSILPQGSLVLLSARPKAGKTTLAVQMAVSIAGGKFFLGRRTEKCKVLFVSLELNQKQMKKRIINVLNYYKITDTKFKKFPLVLRFSSEQRGIEALENELRYLRDKYNITFEVIFIDTYVLFKDLNKEAISKHKSVYELESEYLAKLRKFCEENNTTIVLIYHNRKSQAFVGDITENVMGSVGISGAVNEILLLERRTGEKQAKLLATGHNIEEQEIELQFEGGLFEVLTATKKELVVAEAITEYLKQITEATQTDIFKYLSAKGITKDKPFVIGLLNRFEGEYWKVREEKTTRGRAKKLYSLIDKEIEYPEQETFFEDDIIEKLEGLSDEPVDF